MKNLQRPESRVTSPGQYLDIVDIFPTIQGEGPFAGCPALFIRLAGCNLQCPLCDTEYTENRRTMWLAEIMGEVGRLCGDGQVKLVVITGGEPLRQNITPLVIELKSRRFTVQIETNGKLAFQEPLLPGMAVVVVSPKTASVHPSIEQLATAYKYVVKADALADDLLPITTLDHPVPVGSTIARPPEDFTGTVYVQPADEHDDYANALNMEAAVKAVLSKPGQRRLCLQLHKYADLP